MLSLEEMATVLWYFGKGLQLIALVEVAFALLEGLQTSDPFKELKLLLIGVIIFFVGSLFLKFSSKDSA